MSDDELTRAGIVGWHDLTVNNAADVRDFYKKVIGWDHTDVDMDGYNDYVMTVPGTDDAVAGVCHSKGKNADLPAQWLIYFVVSNVDDSAAECTKLSGEVIAGPRDLGDGRFCVVRDPAGAVCALYQMTK